MLNLDLSAIKETSNTIPEGFYNIIVESAEVKEGKNGSEYIKVKFVVLDEEYSGHAIYHNFFVNSQTSVKAMQIGLAQIKSLMSNAGIPSDKLTDVNTLVGLVVSAKVKIRTSDEYGDQNSISYFKKESKSPKAPSLDKKETFPF